MRVLLAALLGLIVLAQPAHAGEPIVLSIDAAQPTTGVSGAPLGAIVMRARNPERVNGLKITAAIASEPGESGDATLSGPPELSVVTETDGVAIFELTITGPAGDYTLSFSANGATTVTSSTITISAVPDLSITRQPSASAESGTPFAVQPGLDISERDGVAPMGGVVVTATIASGPAGATLNGATTQSSGVDGSVPFLDLTITGPAGAYTISFSATGAVTVTSSAITISAVPALTFDRQPSASAESGTPFAVQPILVAIERDGSAPMGGVVVTAAIASGPGGATLSGTTTLPTAGDGTTGPFNLTITGPAGAYTISFSAAGATTVTSSTITISEPPVVVPALRITRQPSASAESGTPFALQPTLEAVDRDSGSRSPVQDLVITAAIASGPTGATLSGSRTVATNVNGDAEFVDLVITGPAGTYTLSFSATGAATIMSDPVEVSVPPGPEPDPLPEPVLVSAPDVIVGMLTLVLPPTIQCTVPSANSGLWARLPFPEECSFVGGRALTSAQLLGWATAPEFPAALALRQIENGWGAYEVMNDNGHITAVYIRAGGWTAQTGPGQLYPVLNIDGGKSAQR